MFYRRTRPIRRSAEEIAAEKAAKLAKSMTCQCCGRDIFAETGLIAHHGYERPGEGWQTASCWGARALPFEVDRERLGEMITYMEETLAGDKDYLSRLQADQTGFPWQYADKTMERDRRGRRQERKVVITIDTWPATYALYLERREYRESPEPSYEMLKARAVRQQMGKIERLTAAILDQKGRYKAWKQTHRKGGFNEEVWVPL